MYGLTEYVYPGRFYDGFFKSVMNTRTNVRRSQLHSASAGAAKAPYPLAPSSFPKRESHGGLPFRLWGMVRIWIAPVHHVRRTQFRFVSAVCVSAWRSAGNVRRTRLAAKTAHPLRPSSFPKRESHGDSRFGYGERFGLEFPLFPVPRLRREMIRCAQTRKGIPVFNTETS